MSERAQTRPRTMSRIALGCYPLGGGYGGITEREARATIDAALEAGWSFLDTAEAYLDSEERLGHILAGRRDSVFIATKAFPSETYTYEHLRVALDRSLARLQTDRIDLYQLHGPEDWVVRFDDATPLDELADSLTRLRDSGKALRVGVCNLDAETLRTLAERADLFSTQNLYSLLDRGAEDDPIHLPVEREIIPTAAELWARVPGLQPACSGAPRRRPRPASDVHAGRRAALPPPFPARRLPRLCRACPPAAVLGGGPRTIVGAACGRMDPREPGRYVCARRSEVAAAGRGHRRRRGLAASGIRELKEIDEILATLPREPRQPSRSSGTTFQPEDVGRLRDRRYASERRS